jgi:hypothetical protein
MRIMLGSLFRVVTGHSDARNRTRATQEVIRDEETKPIVERRMRSK